MGNEVLIESYDESNRVCVYPFDSFNSLIVGDSIEIIRREDAFNDYEVVGEIIDGSISLFDGGSGEEDFDYDDFFQVEDEEA